MKQSEIKISISSFLIKRILKIDKNNLMFSNWDLLTNLNDKKECTTLVMGMVPYQLPSLSPENKEHKL